MEQIEPAFCRKFHLKLFLSFVISLTLRFQNTSQGSKSVTLGLYLMAEYFSKLYKNLALKATVLLPECLRR